MKKLDQSGFTLVEVVVVSLLSVILAGAIITVFMVYSTETRQLASHMVLQQQYDVVIEELGMRMRNGDRVLQHQSFSNGKVKSIRVERGGLQTYLFSIGDPSQPTDSTLLYEDRVEGGGSPVPFRVGNETVQIASHSISILNDKNISITLQLRNNFDTIPARTERLRCRN